MNLGAFAVVTLVARSNDRRTEVEDYSGIGFRAPALAFTLSIFLLSLLGLPLTAGFIGKVMVFNAAIKAGFYTLVVIAVINTAVSAYYYLRLIIVMFFRERTVEWSAPRVPASVAAAIVITVLGVFYLGLFPNKVLDAFQRKPAPTPAPQPGPPHRPKMCLTRSGLRHRSATMPRWPLAHALLPTHGRGRRAWLCRSGPVAGASGAGVPGGPPRRQDVQGNEGTMPCRDQRSWVLETRRAAERTACEVE
jgi:hypothetical protein